MIVIEIYVVIIIFYLKINKYIMNLLLMNKKILIAIIKILIWVWKEKINIDN